MLQVTRSQLAGGEEPEEIERATRARQEMPDPLDTKIHPRRKPRMQSSGAAGDSSLTSRRCGPGQPGSQRRHRRGKEKRGDSPIRPGATPRDLSFRATWKLALRRARGKTNRGNPANPTEAKSGRCRCPGKLGETTRRSRKVGKAGRPAEPIVGDTERPEAGATPRSASRHRRKMRGSGRLETPSPAKAGDAGRRETGGRHQMRSTGA